MFLTFCILPNFLSMTPMTIKSEPENIKRISVATKKISNEFPLLINELLFPLFAMLHKKADF